MSPGVLSIKYKKGPRYQKMTMNLLSNFFKFFKMVNRNFIYIVIHHLPPKMSIKTYRLKNNLNLANLLK